MATILPDKAQIKNNPTRTVVDDFQVEIAEPYAGNLAGVTTQKGANDAFDAFAGSAVAVFSPPFDDVAARDAYFAAHPEDIVEEMLILINDYPDHTTFVDADLTAGVLTVIHETGNMYVTVTVWDNLDNEISPDNVTPVNATSVDIDLSSFGTLTGAWKVRVA